MNRAAVAGLCIAILLVCGCIGTPFRTGPTATPVPTATPAGTLVPERTAEPPAPVPATMVSVPPTGSYQVLSLNGPAVVRAGDNVTLNGTTILSPGQALLVEVISESFGPAPKTADTAFSGTSGVVSVVKGIRDSENTWSFSFSTKGFAPDTYLVTVSGITVNATATTRFIVEG